MTAKTRTFMIVGLVLGISLAAGAGPAGPVTTTRPYQFNTDLQLTLEKNSEVHLTCPPNPHHITEYVLSYRAPADGQELVGVWAVFADGKRTTWNIPPGSSEGVLQQAWCTPCLAVVTWRQRDGALEVAFRTCDNPKENYRTCRQYILSDKRVGQQYPKPSLIFPDSIGREQAMEDIAFLTEQLKAKHPKPFGRISEKEFGEEVERLEAGLDDPVPIRKFSLSVAALLALLRDAHTKHQDFSAYEDHVKGGGGVLPVKFRYQDGHMTVEAWSPKLAPVRMKAGDVVTAVNGEAMDSLLQRYGRYVATETDLQRCWTLEWAFDRYQVLLGEARDQYRLQLRDAQGQVYEETLPAAPRWLEQYVASKTQGPAFCYDFYHEGRTCLFRIRHFSREALQEYEKAVRGLLEAMREKRTEYLILDLRNNGGGDSGLGMWLLRKVIDKPYAGDLKPGSEGGWPAKLALLCDRSTYSAASWLAMVVQDCHVGIVAGEETGGRASFFGDLQQVTLPNSLLNCVIATGYFPRRSGSDDGRGVLPDLALDVRAEDSVLVEKICTYIRETRGQPPTRADSPAGPTAEVKSLPVSTRPYEFNTDVQLTLEKNSEVHLTCPPNRHSIAEYILYYRVPKEGEELVDIHAVFTYGKYTGCEVPLGSCEGILQQAGYTACLGIMKWQSREGRLDVDFCAADDPERCHREYRQYRLEGKRYVTQYQDRQLVCPVELPELQRLAGFARFWSEVKFNFPFFDRVPELNWDQVLIDYLPQIQQAKTDVEYYRVLMRCVALLKDDHTRVWGPTDEPPCWPPMELRAVEGKAVVVRVCPANDIEDSELKAEFLAAGIKPGDEITHIDGRPVPQILAEDIYPYIAASTPQGLDQQAYPRLARGEKGTKVKLHVRELQGQERDVTLTRGFYGFPREKRTFLREWDGGIVQVDLDSFDSDRVVKQYENAFGKILAAKGLILDVRRNGGGNANFGYTILSTLVEEPVKLSRWKTRQYLPAFRAWGKPETWYEGDGGTMQPSEEKHYQGPVVVLTGPATGSAAEDLVVAFHASGRGKVVGQRTKGSTGQILILDLPGGGGFCICTKRDTYPDGREFLGIGVIPDIEVNPTRRDIADGRDAVLEAALQVLRAQES